MKINLKFPIFVASLLMILVSVWIIVEDSSLSAFAKGTFVTKSAVELSQPIDYIDGDQTAVPAGESSGNTVHLPVIMTPYLFLETFDGDPAAPTQFQSPNWDVTVHTRDFRYVLDAMDAAHGPNCDPPPATHRISTYEEAVFICKNHVMTSIYAPGYGLIYLTPDHLVDFSGGEAVIRFDMSTLRTTGRDWVDVWVTPYEDHLQLPLDSSLPDLSGEPRNGFRIEMSGVAPPPTQFLAFVTDDFNVTKLPRNYGGYEQLFVPDAKRRDTFELRISKNWIKFGMPDYNWWWINTAVNLDWDQGVVQFGHHSYNPDKDCSPNVICGPNSWHWDNISISPAIPFTMLHADRRYVDEANKGSAINFTGPAPNNANLRFSAVGRDIEVSFDGGNSWQDAQVQDQIINDGSKFWSYWTPIPAGITAVHFRGTNTIYDEPWMVRDITIWSRDN